MKYYAVYKPHFENNPRTSWSFLAENNHGHLGHSPRNIHNNLLSGESRAELLFKMKSYPEGVNNIFDISNYVLLPEDEVFP